MAENDINGRNSIYWSQRYKVIIIIIIIIIIKVS